MQIPAKVPALERKVGGDKHFTPGWRTQNRTIVANAERYRLAAGRKFAANLLDQAQLSQRFLEFRHLIKQHKRYAGVTLSW
jgi:hypothetical protein